MNTILSPRVRVLREPDQASDRNAHVALPVLQMSARENT